MPDYTITPANVKRAAQTGQLRHVIWGEAIAAGDAVYRNATDQQYYKTDTSDATKPAVAEEVGLALNSGGIGQQGSIAQGIGSLIDLGLGATVAGEIAVLSANNGKLGRPEELVAPNLLTIFGYFDENGYLALTPIVTLVPKA